jgi:type I restriction-modification system DNA methylase subunit
MVHVDAHYTPSKIARELIRGVDFWPRSVADFACGDGALLACAYNEWPSSVYIANDISTLTASTLAQEYGYLNVSNYDFLGEHDQCVKFIKNLPETSEGEIDLILLNPPFTCKGSRKLLCNIYGNDVKCSVALAFFIKSLKLLSSKGQCLAILPESCFSSEKDSEAISLINRFYKIDFIKAPADTVFRNCSVRVALVKAIRIEFDKINASTTEDQDELSNNMSKYYEIQYTDLQRGKVTVNASSKLKGRKSINFIHTTDISQHLINYKNLQLIAADKDTAINGPVIILPRVGRPRVDKVTIYNSKAAMVLSDCLFSIKFHSEIDAVIAYNRIIDNWNNLSNLYTGTCARYITLNKLKNFLSSVGITNVHMSISRIIPSASFTCIQT